MKTAEITRRKSPLVHPSLPGQPGLPPPSTTALFLQTYRAGGWAAINKGVNAVAIRQMTNWGSRCVCFPFSREGGRAEAFWAA